MRTLEKGSERESFPFGERSPDQLQTLISSEPLSEGNRGGKQLTKIPIASLYLALSSNYCLNQLSLARSRAVLLILVLELQ
jgi:hypothetical protein